MTERAQRFAVPIGGLLAVTWVLFNWNAPLLEDSLFWWVPKGIKAGEAGFPVVPAGDLPRAMNPMSGSLPQWAGGLPDYGHPPLWYWWLGIWTQAGVDLHAIRLATLIPVASAGAGFTALGKRLGAAWAGLAVFGLPPFLAQLLRPELDLPLLAIVPWALIALMDRAWLRFAVLSAAATACKEPGVLLAAPAAVVALQERRWRLAVLTPLLVLFGWGWVHGWMAKPERLPDGFMGWIQDAASVAFIAFISQGRFALLVGIRRFQNQLPLAAFVFTWLAFFSVVGFFANRGTADAYTHVRYLLPAIAVAAVVMAHHRPWLAILGLGWLHIASPYGPEESLFGVHQAKAEREAVPWIKEQVADGQTVWVGTHQAAGLFEPWAGITDRPLRGFNIYDVSTQAGDVLPGHIVLETAYGEPSGTLLTGRSTQLVTEWRVHDGRVSAWRIQD